MGCVPGIDFENYPLQGKNLHKRVSVCFHYDTEKRMTGTIIRDDVVSPFLTVFHLDNGRVILATECQYQFL